MQRINLSKGDVDFIKEKYKDVNFPGSFSGLRTFQANLFHSFKKHYSINDLRRVLETLPSYLSTKQVHHHKSLKQRKFINLYGFMTYCQSDLAEFYEFRGFRYALILIDAFSDKLFTRPLRNKSSESVKQALSSIFEEIGMTPKMLGVDDGNEYKGVCLRFLEKNQVYVTVKTGSLGKAVFAENAIGRLKRKLFQTLRSNLSEDWPAFLSQVTKSMNETKRASGLIPASVTSNLDDDRVYRLKKKFDPSRYRSVNYKDFIKNNKAFLNDKKTKFHLNSYVYIKALPSLGRKESLSLKGNQIFQIASIDRRYANEPYFVRLIDLKGDPVHGTYQERDLMLAPNLSQTDPIFFVEKILKERKLRSGKVQYFVKYKNYPEKFNAWIDADNFVNKYE